MRLYKICKTCLVILRIGSEKIHLYGEQHVAWVLSCRSGRSICGYSFGPQSGSQFIGLSVRSWRRLCMQTQKEFLSVPVRCSP